jgi:hypothetical protein
MKLSALEVICMFLASGVAASGFVGAANALIAAI